MFDVIDTCVSIKVLVYTLCVLGLIEDVTAWTIVLLT